MNETLQSLESQEPAGPSRLTRMASILLPFLGLLLVMVPFSILDWLGKAPGFLSMYNIETGVIQTIVVAIAGFGMTFVIISGGIDLSVGSVIALSTVAVALVLNLPASWHMSVWVAMLAGILAAGLCGLLNGLMITGLRIVPFIATLGMWSIARGVAKLLAREQKIDAPTTWLNDLMVKSALSPGVLILLATLVVMWLLLRYTTFGRYTIAIGSNEPTARLCGVRVRLVKIGIYTLAGLLTGLAGVLQFSRLTVGDPTVAAGLELDVIAAVVIGGGSLSGGEGSILGTLIGALAMSFLRAGCILVDWPNYVQEIFIGIFIVIYVAIDQLRRARTS
jgi:ribose/xylose/arabinose/galactoside ABC-type transport system permease subunit